MINQSPAVSFAIATLNRPDHICKTIEHALAQTGVSVEVIVVDQSDPFDAVAQERLDKLKPRITYIHSTIRNPASARNLALRAAKGEIVLFVDDDVEFGPDLASLHYHSYQAPDIGGVLGLIVPRKWENRDPILRKGGKEYYAQEDNRGDSSLPGILWAPSTNVSYRRAVLDQVGGFDENLFSYCEDADVSILVRRAGYRLLFNAQAELLHFEAPSGGCAHRDQNFILERQRDRLWCGAYYHLKHARFFGWRVSAIAFWKSLRGFVVNRNVMLQGPVHIFRHLGTFISTYAGAFRLLRSSARSRTQP